MRAFKFGADFGLWLGGRVGEVDFAPPYERMSYLEGGEKELFRRLEDLFEEENEERICASREGSCFRRGALSVAGVPIRCGRSI